MFEAWLAGEVPHEVMADWCEDRGIALPRRATQNTRRGNRTRHAGTAPLSGSAEFRSSFSTSSGHYESLSRSSRELDFFDDEPRLEFRTESFRGASQSVSGSRNGPRTLSRSGTGPTEWDLLFQGD